MGILPVEEGLLLKKSVPSTSTSRPTHQRPLLRPGQLRRQLSLRQRCERAVPGADHQGGLVPSRTAWGCTTCTATSGSGATISTTKALPGCSGAAAGDFDGSALPGGVPRQERPVRPEQRPGLPPCPSSRQSQVEDKRSLKRRPAGRDGAQRSGAQSRPAEPERKAERTGGFYWRGSRGEPLAQAGFLDMNKCQLKHTPEATTGQAASGTEHPVACSACVLLPCCNNAGRS